MYAQPTNQIASNQIDMVKYLCWISGIRTWIQQGLPSKMMVFGLPFHGWAWELESSKKHKVFSPAQGPARGQNISMEGLIEYRNIKKFIADNDANNVPMDRNFVIGYTNFGSTWIAYEDEDTIKFKISRVKTNLGLNGYFVWNIAADDEHHSLAKVASREWKKGQGFCCCLIWFSFYLLLRSLMRRV